jgi:hypothetical protein
MRWTMLLLVFLLLPARAAGQGLADYDYENLQFRGLGVEFGRVWPTETRPAYSFGIRADMGYVGPHVRIVPSARFWSSSLRTSEVNRLADQIIRICEKQPGASCPASLDLGEVQRSDLELAADAHYVFDLSPSFQPYAGAGLSLHLLNGRGEFINGTFVEDLLDTVIPGAEVIGGVEVPVAPSLKLLTEARATLTSDLQFVNLVVGGSWTLPSVPAAHALRRLGVR